MVDLENTDHLWAQVSTRDKMADGVFFYAVKTTGVYCRPSCPSRTPKRENVHYYATPEAAENDGFRACLRCHPRSLKLVDPNVSLMQDMARFIEAHTRDPLTLSHLAEEAGMSASHFQRVFKSVIGISPKEFHAASRQRSLRRLLKDGEDVLSATVDAGYGSTSRVYEQVDGALGMTPSAYRAGGFGEVITYASRDTEFGPLMMAATARGVCFVQFGVDEAALLDQLRAEFPKAALEPAAEESNAALDDWMAALTDHLAGTAPRPELPLDLRGTAFQIKVWRFLMSVKAGDIVSYSEVATGIGKPKAVRAAASACGANRIAVLIPCHRALRADGGMGGYRWGVDRKRLLLNQERASASEPNEPPRSHSGAQV